MGVTVRMLNRAVILGFLSVCLPLGLGQFWGNFNLEKERQNQNYQKPKWYSQQDYYDDYNYENYKEFDDPFKPSEKFSKHTHDEDEEQKERTFYPVHEEHHNLGHEYGYGHGHGHRYRSPAVTPLVFLAPLAGILLSTPWPSSIPTRHCSPSSHSATERSDLCMVWIKLTLRCCPTWEMGIRIICKKLELFRNS